MKITRMSFGGSVLLEVGTPSTFELRVSPDMTFRPECITANFPWSGIVQIDEFTIGNISVLIGLPMDAAYFDSTAYLNELTKRRTRWSRFVEFIRTRVFRRLPKPQPELPRLQLPVMTPSTPLVIRGRYNGKAFPAEMAKTYLFYIRLSGPGMAEQQDFLDEIIGERTSRNPEFMALVNEAKLRRAVK